MQQRRERTATFRCQPRPHPNLERHHAIDIYLFDFADPVPWNAGLGDAVREVAELPLARDRGAALQLAQDRRCPVSAIQSFRMASEGLAATSMVVVSGPMRLRVINFTDKKRPRNLIVTRMAIALPRAIPQSDQLGLDGPLCLTMIAARVHLGTYPLIEEHFAAHALRGKGNHENCPIAGPGRGRWAGDILHRGDSRDCGRLNHGGVSRDPGRLGAP
jgi:hypothetical protein